MGCGQSSDRARVPPPASHTGGGPPQAQLQGSEAAAHLAATAKLLAIATADVTAEHAMAMHAQLDEPTRQGIISDLRAALVSAQNSVDALEEALPSLTASRGGSTRSGHLRTLTEQIGARPQRKWQEDWAALTEETLELQPWLSSKAASERDVATKQATDVKTQSDIAGLVADGWPESRAATYILLHARKAAIARALRDGSRVYAAATYALCDAIYSQHADSGASHIEAMLYSHVDGLSGLALNEPKWRDLETPDRTGFRGHTSSSLVSADCDPGRFSAAGHCAFDSAAGMLVPQDSDVVGFLPKADNNDGAHSAVSQGAMYGCFPPNTLFRLREVKAAGTWVAPGGARPKQRLLVVTATFRPEYSLEAARLCSGGKMCSALSYGTRQSFVDGIDDLSEYQTLAIGDEWRRAHTWSDWKGASYTMNDEWDYVTGIARCTPGRTAGTRDEHNHGKSVGGFLDDVNGFLLRRRAATRERMLARRVSVKLLNEDDDALLTRDEVLAVRLYTGPGYQPINDFLRQIANVSGVYRREMIQHPGITLAATVLHLIAAIRKLSAVATEEEASAPLWRGVRGALPRGFWHPDAAGMVCAVDMAFMSTSRAKSTPVEYMQSDGENVLWSLKPGIESETGFHCGADVSLLSQFSQEKEVLFPPATMLEVVDSDSTPLLASGHKSTKSILDSLTLGTAPGDDVAEAPANADGKRYTEIRVRPTFV